MPETCGTCRHFQVAANSTEAGRCRAHPPTFSSIDATGQWPGVMAISGCGEWSRGIKDSPVTKMSAEEAVARENYTRQFQDILTGVHDMCGKIERRLARAQPEILESFREAVAREGTFHRWLLNEATPNDIKAIAGIPPETIRLSLENYRRRRQQAVMGAAAPLEDPPRGKKGRAKVAAPKIKKRLGRPPGSKNKPRR